MSKEILEIINELLKKPTTELILQLMGLSAEYLILEHQYNKQKEIIDKSIKYIQSHQIVFRDATLEETEEWFNQFYIDVLDILKEEEND